jgi:signal transduction histidine kinase
MTQGLPLNEQCSEPRSVLPVTWDQDEALAHSSSLAMSRLVHAVQELSLARDLNDIMAVVRHAARELTGADGATFVVRDGDLCHYADEESISPLWKGQRFPMSTCISGWVMLHGQAAVIENIFSDPRVPVDAYLPTFVKSLAMVPIRTSSPIGAIGIYWAARRQPAEEEVHLLQALANTTAVAMENVQVYAHLEQRVKERTAALEAANAELQLANAELDSFSHAVSHDLGAPLRGIQGFLRLALTEGGALSDEARDYLKRAAASAKHMRELIDDLLRLSQVSRLELRKEKVNLSHIAGEILDQLKAAAPDRRVLTEIADEVMAIGDGGLLRAVLENLLSNAWKYTAKSDHARISFEANYSSEGLTRYSVRDNGVGFDMSHVNKLFQPFERLHNAAEYPGSGIGLTTVQRIIHRHGGRVWAEAQPGKGAAFHFTLP